MEKTIWFAPPPPGLSSCLEHAHFLLVFATFSNLETDCDFPELAASSWSKGKIFFHVTLLLNKMTVVVMICHSQKPNWTVVGRTPECGRKT